MRNIICLIAILFFLSVTVFAQDERLGQCTQALGKAVGEVSACRDAFEAQKALADSTLKTQDKLLEIIVDLQIALKGKDAVIDELRRVKCNETEWKFKPLGFTLWSRSKKTCL